MKKVYLVFTLFILVALVLACTGNSATSNQTSTATGTSGSMTGTITVSNKADTEGSLLGQIITQMLQANGFQVNLKAGITGTQLIRKAILSGDIDMYPEYTGNGAFFFNETSSSVWSNAQQGYDEVKKLDKEQNNIVWLQPAPANNTWAIAITQKLSQSENLKSLTDLAAYVNRGGNLKLAGSQEFITSPVALPAFEKAYNFNLKQSQLVTLAGGNTAQTEKAAADGTDGVNAAMAYGTDGSLNVLNLVILSDPKGAQPVYEPTPIVRGDIYAKYPHLSTILDPVFKSLTLTTLQDLNGKIAVNGESPTSVAHDYLVSKGFLK